MNKIKICMSRLHTVLFAVLVLNFAGRVGTASTATDGLTDSSGVANLNALSDDDIRKLLDPTRHIGDIAMAYFHGLRDPRSDEYALLQQQIKALNAIADGRNVVPAQSLVVYLDYPAAPSVPRFIWNDLNLKVELQERLKAWPALNAIWRFRADFAGPLIQYVSDTSNDIAHRLTVLQILEMIKPVEVAQLAVPLEKEFKTQDQMGAVRDLQQIEEGRLPFWGLLQFRAIKFNREQIESLLTANKHLDIPPNKSRSRADIEIFDRQVQALHDAGDLGMTDLVPSLIMYMDYPGRRLIWSYGSKYPESRAEDWPAFGAIWVMGEAAVPKLLDVIGDADKSPEMRLTALAVLKYIDATKSLDAGSSLLKFFTDHTQPKAAAAVQQIALTNYPEISYRRILSGPGVLGPTSAALSK